MLRVQNEEVELGESEKLRHARGGPGEETAEEGLSLQNSLAKVRSFQFSVLSFQFPNQGGGHSLDLTDQAGEALMDLLGQ